MDCYAVERENCAEPRLIARIIAGLIAAFTPTAERGPRLDLEIMPDRIKRDLGFRDGREPRYEEDLRR
ncbi:MULTISPECIES: hypothetical protein [unclassified Sinorhizobium]|uniref:hypothetical protein n=1 Tax=unclassified Sinorhizobium TaxID=2613772 RepID=UPI0035256B6C